MRLLLSWLNEYVSLSASVDDIAKTLVRLGHEVEAIEYPRADLSKVLVGKILTMEPHPNADRLKLLTINIGEDKPLAIVCGASNMTIGDCIPVATIGATLPNGMTIKKGKVRGEVSCGMCCSEAELKLADDADGLLILPSDAEIGQSMGDFLQLEEAIIELSITPNRGDCMSVLGLARELAADFNVPLKEPTNETIQPSSTITPTIHYHAQQDCPYYLARHITGITLSNAPKWLQDRLLAAGQRSVNGVVDILNYIMLDMGQPMHAFDAKAIHGGLHIRSATEGEGFDGLDGRHIDTHAGDLLIADDGSVLAMAGIMGSIASGVETGCTDIVLESAFFRPARISLTRRSHGMVSEASMRFERGIDAAQTHAAMARATAMIVTYFGGQAGDIVVAGDNDSLCQHQPIAVNIARIASRIGMAIEPHIDATLRGMGFGIKRNDDSLHIDVPSWRHDVTIAEDMSEEYARIIGYEQLPAILPTITMNHIPDAVDWVAAAIAQGYVQTIGYAFISPEHQRIFTADDGCHIALSNPISTAMSVMRRSIWPGLLSVAQHNMNRQQKGVSLVEVGRIYKKDDSGIIERNTIAWLITGEIEADTWHGKYRIADFYDVKGAVEHWCADHGVSPRIQAGIARQGLQQGQIADIRAGRHVVGCIARVDDDVAAQFNLTDPVYVAEINCDLLPTAKQARFASLPEYPSVQRDLVFVLPRTVTAEVLLTQARKAAGNILTDVSVFDIYMGKGIADHCISMGIRMTLQTAKQTLGQDECDAIAARVIEAIETKLAAKLR